MAPTIFAIANQKGGVGKTTTAIQLSAALARQKIKVLLVDLDPQGNATSGLGQETNTQECSLLNALSDPATTPLPYPSGEPQLSLLPSHPQLATLESRLGNAPDAPFRLKKALQQLSDEAFSVILIDCPPALGLLSLNGLNAASYLLVPLQSEYFALEGLGQILNFTEQIKTSGSNPNLELGGILLTMHDARTRLAKDVAAEVKKHFDEKVFHTTIPRTVRLAEAPSFGKSIFQYARFNQGAFAYQKLAKECIRRFHLGNRPSDHLG